LVANAHHKPGKRDAIETDMPVVTDVGWSEKRHRKRHDFVVLLVSDENCRIAASVEGSREQGSFPASA
jgi:Cell shape-determining protein